MSPQNLPAMAWRNLWRNRRRTLLTLFSIVFGVFLAIMFTALQDRNWADMIDLAARLGGGHVSVQNSQYMDTPSLKKTLRNTDALVRIARTVKGVTQVTQRISGPAMLNTTTDSFGAAFIAFDPANETKDTLALLDPAALLSGKMFSAADERGIILGYRLAENLGAKPGNKIVYTMTDKQGDIVSGLARLTGTIKTGAPGLDASLGLLPINTIRHIIGYGPDESTQLSVFVNDQRSSGKIAARLSQAINMPEVAILPWYESRPELAAFIAMKVGGTRFVSAFVALLVAAGIFNTLFVSVMERMREFGILTAIGFSPGRIFALVMLESLWLALIGLAGAAAVTILPYRYLADVGIDISKVVAEQGTIDIAGVAMSTTLKVGIFPSSVVMICIAAVAATLMAGLYPAWRASTVNPVDAIKLV